jgi:PAS domain S-box-containing protein
MNNTAVAAKSDMSKTQTPISAGVFAIVLSYAFFAGLWILLSDEAMGLLFSDPALLVQASMAKGWFFVAVTSLLLYVLVSRLVGRLEAAHRRELDYERAQKQPPPMLVAIAEASPDAIFAKDEEGRYLLFNNAAARFVGKPVEDVLGKDDRAIFPPEQAESIMAVARQVCASGQTEFNEEALQTAAGERVFLTIKGPLRGADGRIFGTYGISHDITERKQAETLLHENQERLRLLVDHAPAALAMFDRDMRYLEVSQCWRDDYCVGDRDIIGHSHYEIFPDLPEVWKVAHRRGMAGEIVSADEDRFERADGTVLWSRWEVRPWKKNDGTVGGIVIFSEDITRRKMADENLIRRNEELEHFNRAATERELRMIALKREVNDMARAAGRPAPYDTSFADAP